MINFIFSINQKSTRLLRMYSYTSWFFTVFIHFVLSIVSIVAMITRKDVFISYRNVIRNNHDNADDVKYQLIWSFVVLFFQGFLYVSILNSLISI
jgi:hypothetical protein